MMRNAGFASGVASVAMMLAGCGDGGGGGGGTRPPDAGTGPPLWGTVMSLDDSSFVEGARVALIDGPTYTVVAGPVETDETGTYRFLEAPEGTYSAFLFNSGLFGFDRSAAQVSIAPGRSVRQDFRLIESDLFSTSGGFRVRGTVRDAETGFPIRGAYVSASCCQMSLPFEGLTLPWEAVTDSSGTFQLQALSARVDERGMPSGLVPIGVSKEGYRTHLIGDLELPGGSDSTATLNVELRRTGPTAGLHGRVLLDGTPATGIHVGLDVYESPGKEPEPFGRPRFVPALGRIAVTDGDGAYAFHDLDPGFYTVQAGFLPGDGFAADYRALRQVDLSENDFARVGDIELVRDCAVVSPARRSHVIGLPIVFEWEPVPRADLYRLWTTAGHTFGTSIEIRDGTRWELGGVETTAGETYHIRWYVDAFRVAPGDTHLVGTFEEFATFTWQTGGTTPRRER